MPLFKIGNTVIKNPSTFKKERYKVTTMDRRADALMVGDLIAKKRKFYFTYEAITSTDLDTILEAIWDIDDLFFTLTYEEKPGEVKTATVYVGSIPAELHRAGNNEKWVWKNVSFNLIEQ